jgi:hypothetical protein
MCSIRLTSPTAAPMLSVSMVMSLLFMVMSYPLCLYRAKSQVTRMSHTRTIDAWRNATIRPVECANVARCSS